MHGGATMKNIRRTGVTATIKGEPNPEYPEAVILTLRQQEICDLVVIGLTNKEIAQRIGLGYRTIESHRENIYRKFGVRNAVELVRKTLGAK